MIENFRTDESLPPMHFFRFDLRGHGETIRLNPSTQKAGHINGGFDMVFSDINEIIQKLLVQDLAVDSIILFGHSMGGLIALEYARTQDQKMLKKLIISGTYIIYKVSILFCLYI